VPANETERSHLALIANPMGEVTGPLHPVETADGAKPSVAAAPSVALRSRG
jgi:hypothetical protein